jgi:hypothetical protein
MVDKSNTGKIIFLLNFIIVLVFGWVLGELGERKKQSRKQSCTVTEHVNNSLTNHPCLLSNGLVHTNWFCALIT